MERGKKIEKERAEGRKREGRRVDSTDANSPTKTECIKPKAQPARGAICINVLAAASTATAKHVPRHPIKGLATLCFLLPGVVLPVSLLLPDPVTERSSSSSIHLARIARNRMDLFQRCLMRSRCSRTRTSLFMFVKFAYIEDTKI